MGQLSNRSYLVEVDGQVLRRNCAFLRPTTQAPPLMAQLVEDTEVGTTKSKEGFPPYCSIPSEPLPHPSPGGSSVCEPQPDNPIIEEPNGRLMKSIALPCAQPL